MEQGAQRAWWTQQMAMHPIAAMPLSVFPLPARPRPSVREVQGGLEVSFRVQSLDEVEVELRPGRVVFVGIGGGRRFADAVRIPAHRDLDLAARRVRFTRREIAVTFPNRKRTWWQWLWDRLFGPSQSSASRAS